MRANEIKLDINVPNQGECIAYNALGGKWQPLDCNQPKLFTCDRRKIFLRQFKKAKPRISTSCETCSHAAYSFRMQNVLKFRNGRVKALPFYDN